MAEYDLGNSSVDPMVGVNQVLVSYTRLVFQHREFQPTHRLNGTVKFGGFLKEGRSPLYVLNGFLGGKCTY